MSPAEAAARAVAAHLRAAGFLAYLAGGYVRDRCLGVYHHKDFDVATDATPHEVQRLFPKTVPVGAQFGVMLVVADGHAIEVATFRSDEGYADGRHPVAVRYGTPAEDAQRRDFTINGMFFDPVSDQVIDLVGGRQDLEARIIRAIGEPEARLREDRLRMLRGVRLAARLGFEIEPRTFAAIRAAAHGITDIAWERIGDEIVRMLTDSANGSARRAFELLDATGLLEPILPEVAALRGVEQSPDYHPEGDVFAHTLLLLAQLEQPTETLALAALLHDIAKPQCAVRGEHRITFYGHCELGAEMAVGICQRLRRSRETRERVGYLVRQHLRPLQAAEMRTSTLKRFLAEDGIDEVLELARLDALASTRDLSAYEFCRAKLAELGADRLKPAPLLRGQDLIGLGFKPGPRFREILDAVTDAQLDGTLETREGALAWVVGKYSR
jgi:tRNA nucleotidyltransferase/poly(A) polymerase